MAVDAGAQRSRRAILAGALGGLGAVALQALGRPASVEAVANGNVQLGHGTADTDNDSATETRVNATNTTITALSAYSLGSGTGLRGSTVSGQGVYGTATTGIGLSGQAFDSGVGVSGTSSTGVGVSGSGPTGVLGSGGIGVKGNSDNGTGVLGLTQNGTAVEATATQGGTGVDASTVSGLGLRARSTDNTPSLFNGSSNKTGVIGTAGSLDNVAANTDETGVYGFADVSPNSVGVVGQSSQGAGVLGIGAIGVEGIGTWAILGDVAPNQIGVYGNTGADPAPIVTTGIGVLARAQSTAQLALRVLGRVSFSRSGRVAFSAGTSSKSITMAGVTTSSFILATPQTNRTGLFVQAVVPGSGKFTIYLNKSVSATTYVGYLVLN